MTKKSKKRANGDGSIYRRGESWECALTVAGTRRTRTRSSFRDAEAALKELRRQRDAGLLVEGDRVTFSEYVEDWLSLKKADVVFTTYQRYRGILATHATPTLGKKRLIDVKAQDLDRLYAARQRAGASKQTVLHLHRVLHGLLDQAERHGRVPRNEARLAKPPTPPQHVFSVYSAKEVRSLIAVAAGTRWGAAIIVAVTTGLRQGELLGLHWSDVDWDAGSLHITKALKEAESGLIIAEPKTPKSRRRVELPDVALNELKAHRARQASSRLALGSDWDDRGLIFPDDEGGYASGNRLSREFKALALGADMRVIPFRNLRHTFATMHVETDEHISVVSRALGHTRTAITGTLYTSPDRTHQRRAADRLGLLLAPADDGVAGPVAGEEPQTG